MGDRTSIEWTDATWGVVRGCSRVSEGCRNCYAERIAARFSGPGQPYYGFAQVVAPRDTLDRVGGRRDGWTREVKLVVDRLSDPLRWKKPRKIFVTSMADVFHEKLTDEEIAAIFGVMAAAPHHTYQVLTKRAHRMRQWFEIPGIADRVEIFRQIALAGRIQEYFAPERVADLSAWPGYAVTSKGRIISNRRGADREMRQQHGAQGHARVELYRDDVGHRELVHRLVLATFDREPRQGEQGRHVTGDATNNALWNLKWGTQSENWDDSKLHGNRRRYSKLTPGQVDEIRRLAAGGMNGEEIGRRFDISGTQARNIVTGKQWTPEPRPTWPLPGVWLGVSTEDYKTAEDRIPELLETPAAIRYISAEPLLGEVGLFAFLKTKLRDEALKKLGSKKEMPGLDWVIAGCESGPGARACDVDWLRSIRDECASAGVAFFLKQATPIDGAYTITDLRPIPLVQGRVGELIPTIGVGANSHEKAGGVIVLPYLDGVQHAAFPEIR